MQDVFSMIIDGSVRVDCDHKIPPWEKEILNELCWSGGWHANWSFIAHEGQEGGEPAAMDFLKTEIVSVHKTKLLFLKWRLWAQKWKKPNPKILGGVEQRCKWSSVPPPSWVTALLLSPLVITSSHHPFPPPEFSMTLTWSWWPFFNV